MRAAMKKHSPKKRRRKEDRKEDRKDDSYNEHERKKTEKKERKIKAPTEDFVIEKIVDHKINISRRHL